MNLTWVLVAESSQAKILERKQKGPELKHITTITYPRTRLKNVDLESDRPGKRGPMKGTKTIHTCDPKQHAHEVEQERYAKRLIKTLEKNFNQNRFSTLVLIAPSPLLGKMKQALPHTLSKALIKVVSKDPSSWFRNKKEDVAEKILELL